MAVSLHEFRRRLIEAGLFSTKELARFEQQLPADRKPHDAGDLAAELYRAGRITKYQAAACWQGKHRQLVLGDYVILDHLGTGGMGQVFKARHRTMDRVVALKLITTRRMQSPEAVERFRREVRAAARLVHPNIVIAHDAREQEGVHCLVMEYVDGEDLATVARRRGPLPVEEAVDYILQAARGLQYAHEQGVVHRDIKPANLLLDRQGVVKVLDMGLARLADSAAADEDRLTSEGQVMGTVDYIAPEQVEDTHGADHRADIYSLGCTLYRLVAGRKPFTGERAVSVALAHLRDPVPSLRAVRPDVPEALDEVCRQMMAKRPEQRPQSMAEVIAALEACVPRHQPQALSAAPSLDPALGSFLDRLAAEPVPPVAVAARRATRAGQSDVETLPGLWGRLRAAARDKPIGYPIAAGLLVVMAVFLSIVLVMRLTGGSPQQVAQSGADTASGTARGESGSGRQARSSGTTGGSAKTREGESEPQVPSGQRDTDVSMSTRLPPAAGTAAEESNTARVPAAYGPGAPPKAVSPFDAQQARKHQEAWARYLGVPVEYTNSIGMKFVLIPPGGFTMGTADEEAQSIKREAQRRKASSWIVSSISAEVPRHRVRITRAFYLGACEVTQAQYEQVLDSNPSKFPGQADRPVEQVTWHEAVEFCEKLAALPAEKAAGAVYRLPTEAEWEHACRAGTTTRFSFGDDPTLLDEYAWWGQNSAGTTHPVGSTRPNAWGLFGMHGNVREWCADRWSTVYYARSPRDDPAGPAQGTGRVLRGGSWWLYDATLFRSAWRCFGNPASRIQDVGFRVLLEIALPSSEPVSPEVEKAASPLPYGPDAPALAVAPFDAATARKHQDAWAKYLGVPVEYTNSIGMKFVLIPPGEFLMGSSQEEVQRRLEEAQRGNAARWCLKCLPSEAPRHRVRITKPFYLGSSEVTQKEYQQVMGTNPSQFRGITSRPVERVGWHQAMGFCEKLDLLDPQRATGTHYRLPTEAEWEYACRAGTTTQYSFGDEAAMLGKHAWWHENADGVTHPVRTTTPNAWGLFDMHGNVWEWCDDWYAADYYVRSPLDDPVGPSSGLERVLRGGSWEDQWPTCCRCAFRKKHNPHIWPPSIGFRVVLEVALKSGASAAE